ncbi:PREDICTED: arylacetamide deacetylase-like 4 [Nanorana parkeri]|uniref:arylacetamide deacetylase-like 4 n=1 Tax=Nanorana parkeri TaxID=125878 RepID=UPI000854AB5C|nr:PREDICTED: arylacetamide deacetylase-like 4 [Nanorana parkeri]
MLLLVIGVFLLLCTLLFVGTVYHEFSTAEFPTGIACRTELRKLHGLVTVFSVLGSTLEKLGVWSELGVLRLLGNLYPICSVDDPELFIKILKFEGVPVRVYQPRESSAGGRKGVMFFHGGGFIFGDSDLYDKLCRQISKKAGVVVVVSVGYRLAPKHLYPAAFEDCLNATIHFLKTAQDYGVNPSSVVICGDSAGGNLTAGVAQALVTRKDIPKPLAQVLIYPVVQMIDFNLPSYQQNSGVPLLLIDKALFYMLNYLGEGVQTTLHNKVQNGSHVPPDLRKKFSKWLSADNIPDEFKVTGYKPHTMSDFDKNVYEKVKQIFEPPCSPLVAEDSVFRLLPKAYILTCEFDVLRDESILYKKRLEDNGVSVTWHHIKDGFHGIISFCDQWDCESGKRAVDSFVSFIRDA